jgi:hypothetical protein
MEQQVKSDFLAMVALLVENEIEVCPLLVMSGGQLVLLCFSFPREDYDASERACQA